LVQKIGPVTLKNWLQVPDVQVFVSEYSVAPGVPLAAAIQNAIRVCDLFILLWSKNAAASEWVPQEIGIARGSNKTILPFVLEKDLPLHGFIKDVRYVAAFQNPQQSAFALREIVLKNSLMKQNQQAMAALAVGGLLLLFLVGMSKS
jgi:hypothetical protein